QQGRRGRSPGPGNPGSVTFSHEDLLMKPINAFWAWIAVPALLLTCLFGCAGGSGVELQGTGSSFDLPIFTVWFKEFKATHPDVTISYSAGGSGKGIADFTGGLTD